MKDLGLPCLAEVVGGETEPRVDQLCIWSDGVALGLVNSHPVTYDTQPIKHRQWTIIHEGPQPRPHLAIEIQLQARLAMIHVYVFQFHNTDGDVGGTILKLGHLHEDEVYQSSPSAVVRDLGTDEAT